MQTGITAPLCVLVMLVPAGAAAQGAGGGSPGAGAGRGDIVVTANRAPVDAASVGQSVTVIGEEAIERSQDLGLTELLARTPGVAFSRNGGRGTATSLYIRGAETGQTLVLYDGVRLNDPSAVDGGASLADVLAGPVERIEVLRGAQSVLYGSQAIGGVVNIVSRLPDAALEGEAQAEGGSLASHLLRAGLGGTSGALTWRAAAAHAATRGISAYAPGTERDGYENLSLNARLVYALAPGAAVDLRSYYSDGEAEFDGFASDSLERGVSRSWLGYAGFLFPFGEAIANRIAYARTQIHRTNYDDAPARVGQPVTLEARGTTERVEYQGTVRPAAGMLGVFGLDHAASAIRLASPSPTGPDPAPLRARDDTLGLYAQFQVEPLAGLALTGGIRREEHSTFGGSVVGSASLAFSPNDGRTILRASWGEGFKAPSLYQLYSEYGNTALAPEEADSWDAGLEQRLGTVLTLSATYFERRASNLIDFAVCSAPATQPLCADGRFGYYENVARARTRGAEFAAALGLGAFTASANYTWLDAVNASPGTPLEGRRLARRPENAFNAEVNYTWRSRLVTWAALRIAGASFNDAANARKLAGYTLVDLRLSYPVSERIELYGRVENAFDERYETIADYGTLGRTASAGVRLGF